MKLVFVYLLRKNYFQNKVLYIAEILYVCGKIYKIAIFPNNISLLYSIFINQQDITCCIQLYDASVFIIKSKLNIITFHRSLSKSFNPR